MGFEDVVFKKTHSYDGAWFCPKDAADGSYNCYGDFDSYFGFLGKPPRIDGTVLATDYDNWIVTYACY